MIGILSTLDNPQLPGYLASLNATGLSDCVVICDSKRLSENQTKILFDRLGGWNIEEHFNFYIERNASSIPFYFVDNHNSSDCLALIHRLGCSFLLNAGTPRKLNRYILNSTTRGVLNIHPGSLPSYRGKNCPEWAVYYNEPVMITAHLMDSEYDQGNVLGLLEVDWRSLNNYLHFRRQVYLKSFELASKVSLELSLGKSKVLFNSNDVNQPSIIHNSMPDELMLVVKNRFNNFS